MSNENNNNPVKKEHWEHACGYVATKSQWELRAIYQWDLKGDGKPLQFYECACGSDICKEGSLTKKCSTDKLLAVKVNKT